MNTVNDPFSNARFLARVQDLLARSVDRLSSGARNLDPSDDPKAAAQGEKLTGLGKRIQAASTNVQNAVSYLQTADAFVRSMDGLVNRMSELSTLATDLTRNPEDIALYQSEFSQLQEQLRSTIGGTTSEIGGTYGITKPLGSFSGNVLFGANPGGTEIATGENPGESVALPEINFRDGAMLELIRQDSSGNYTLLLSDSDAVTKMTAGLQDLAEERSMLGAATGRFDLVAENLTKRGENMVNTMEAIHDVNVATESTHLARYQILTQAATVMLAQANQSPRSVLKLLE